MTTFVSKSLARKREMLENNEKGFTLIELLVVVLIIGVLAAIAIPVYLVTQDTAKDNTVKASVTEAKTSLMANYTATGQFVTVLENLPGFSQSPDITITVSGTETDFCILGSWVDGSHGFYATHNEGTTVGDECPA